MSATDWRGLCEELIALVECCPVTTDTDWITKRNDLIVRVHGARRPALAQPVTKWVTDEAATEGAAELIYSQAMEWAARQPIPSGHINIPAWQQGGNSDAQEVARRTARAVLAAVADGPAVQSREPASVVGELSYELVAQWMAEVWHEGTPVRVAASDLHLASRAAEWGARYAHQPTPPAAAAGEVGELVAALRTMPLGMDAVDPTRDSVTLTRAADLLERQAAPVLEPALARINDILNDSGRILQTDELEALELARQALEQRHPAPVPVSERLPGPEDCDAEGRCWWFSPADPSIGTFGVAACWVLRRPEPDDDFRTHWLPATALPLPSGEVQP